MNQSLDINELLREVHGNSVENFLLPPPSFTVMKCAVIAFDKDDNIYATAKVTNWVI